ncbi:MAG: shikimate kinase [Defluviitaleaceae bacterium]|nr:shikimate kinase [Defluviitaleaceae bacterium]
MKLLVICGNAAVGKMTVGQELMKITEMRLFHNHMTIEPVIEIFGKYDMAITTKLRRLIFEEFASSGCYGMIFTYMWDFGHQPDHDYIEALCDIFRQHGAEIYFAELVASQAARLARNTTENRLRHKATKRDVAASEARLLHADQNFRCESRDGEFPYDNYVKIDNTNLPPDAVARMIKDKFML